VKKYIATVLLVVCWLTTAAQLPPSNPSLHFQRTNLVVRWKAAKKPWPPTLWIFQAGPTRFSTSVISNLMEICCFTETDKKDYGDSGMVFSQPNGSRNLRISFPEATIEYWSTCSYEPTNLARDVPSLKQIFTLTSALLPRIGIVPSELSTTEKGKPKFVVFESPAEYNLGNTPVTNVLSRSIRFSRALDGIELYGDGGNGEVEFGDHAQITKLSLSWRKIQRTKSYPTATPQTIVEWLRKGRATYRLATRGLGTWPIDWASANQITINKAQAFYWGQVYQTKGTVPSSTTVRPFAALLATVGTGSTNIDIAIQCPILLDENSGDASPLQHPSLRR
jgi:hypothetical protein